MYITTRLTDMTVI